VRTVASETGPWKGDEYARKWLTLAEQRRDDLVALYRSGAWRRYFSESEFLAVMRAVKADVECWGKLAGVAPEPLRKAG